MVSMNSLYMTWTEGIICQHLPLESLELPPTIWLDDISSTQHKAPAGLSCGPTETKSGHRQTVMVPEGEISLFMVCGGDQEERSGSTGQQWAKYRLLNLLTCTLSGPLPIIDTCHQKLILLHEAGRRSLVYNSASSVRSLIDQPSWISSMTANYFSSLSAEKLLICSPHLFTH